MVRYFAYIETVSLVDSGSERKVTYILRPNLVSDLIAKAPTFREPDSSSIGIQMAALRSQGIEVITDQLPWHVQERTIHSPDSEYALPGNQFLVQRQPIE